VFLDLDVGTSRVEKGNREVSTVNSASRQPRPRNPLCQESWSQRFLWAARQLERKPNQQSRFAPTNGATFGEIRKSNPPCERSLWIEPLRRCPQAGRGLG
jgi:hypothetical protein